jgi:hypothetical protein
LTGDNSGPGKLDKCCRSKFKEEADKLGLIFGVDLSVLAVRTLELELGVFKNSNSISSLPPSTTTLLFNPVLLPIEGTEDDDNVLVMPPESTEVAEGWSFLEWSIAVLLKVEEERGPPFDFERSGDSDALPTRI